MGWTAAGRAHLRLPSGLDHWRQRMGGPAWLERLPRLASECAEQWELRLGQPFMYQHASLTLRVELSDGTPAVLKLNFPEAESEHEAEALSHWDGEGAVRLLAHEPERRALLLERCEPGTQLWDVADDEQATRIAAAALRGLSRPPPSPHPFRLLADEAARWAVELPERWEQAGRPFERGILDAALAAIRDLGPSQVDEVVLHQDFHGGNILRSSRQPWLVIDPKPLVGDRAFDTASLLRDRRHEAMRDPAGPRILRRRLDQLEAELGLDRERMRGWAIAHALAWGFSGLEVNEAHIWSARVFAEA